MLFSLEFKLSFLREWDAAVPEPGARTALLRRYNLRHSTVYGWRKAREDGRFEESMITAAQSPSRRQASELRGEVAHWKARAEAAEEKARTAEAAQEILGKAFELLEGINTSSAPLPQIPPALMSAEEYRLYLQRLDLS